ncbi:hypothetical protein GCM10025787_33720 [Saccharopolyspora rosea]|uniref:Uncharacterized protein n=1 Tax=Saccharopolyspora rosea TaxID=524884 RepID=A0ABW3FWB6_9PSEU
MHGDLVDALAVEERGGEDFLGGYYGFAPEYAVTVVDGALCDEEAVRDAALRLREAGCDEAIFVPCSASVDQISLLRGAVRE